MEQDGFKIEINENNEHILVECTKEAKNGWGIIEIPKDVTGIYKSAFSDLYGPLQICINSYSLVPDLIKSGISGNSKIYDYNYSRYSWVSLEVLEKLYEIYPAAFEAKKDGKCLFDNNSIVSYEDSHCMAIVRLIDDQRNTVIVLAEPGAFEEIPYSVTFKQGSFISDFHNQDSIEYTPLGRWNGEVGTKYAVDAFVRLDSSYGSSCSIVIPSSISTVIIDGSRQLNTVTFTGSLPEHLYLDDEFKAEKIYINEPRNEVMKHPSFESLESAVERKSSYDDGVIIYAAPQLCNDDSLNPGYIVLTEPYYWNRKHGEDHIVEINTFFIASIEPYPIECYTPVEGTLLKLSIEMKADRRYDYLVYEPIDVVRKKIRESLDRIDVRYLAFQVDSWNKYKEGK